MPHDIAVALIAARYLAGPGDPAWITVPLHHACGWSSAKDPLVPQVILTSPDQRAQLRIDPDPDEPWWAIRHTRSGDQPPWSVTFDARTPVEIIAALTDALTDPSGPPPTPGHPYGPLRAAGWHAPRYHDGLTSPDGMSSPNGLARVDRVTHNGGTTSWIVETSGPQLPAIWRAYLDGNTPVHLVAALFRALADETPLIRDPHRVPALASAQGTTITRRVPVEAVAFALENRVANLAARHTAMTTRAPAALPLPKQRRRR
ncbi:DUF317 domain-containing protein [Streptomyces sp. 769]|uniref:DUF317 domain-containing protein n=1 Tax=Streptomyces sp. 769 TaxID=1262452 RepID=UPI000AB3F9F5|nr:DUF317 domain-containing protein [Streptomyces sp. 769]